MLAELMLMVTALPIIYYFYTMYEVNEKTRYLVGLVAGGWGIFGVILVIVGVIQFTYYIIYVILLILVFLFEKIMGLIDENFDEDEMDEYEIEWPVEVSNAGMAFIVVIMIVLFYTVFLITPVSPARINDSAGFDEDEGPYKSFPDGYKYEYTKPGSYVVVLTIRAIPISHGMLDGQLENGNKEVEEYIHENYGEDVSIEFTTDDEIDIKGYDAIEKDFDIYRNGITKVKIGEMTLQGFYYNDDLEVIVLGYFYPNGAKETSVNTITANLEL
jgi:hypothetical protein